MMPMGILYIVEVVHIVTYGVGDIFRIPSGQGRPGGLGRDTRGQRSVPGELYPRRGHYLHPQGKQKQSSQ